MSLTTKGQGTGEQRLTLSVFLLAHDVLSGRTHFVPFHSAVVEVLAVVASVAVLAMHAPRPMALGVKLVDVVSMNRCKSENDIPLALGLWHRETMLFGDAL